MEKLSFNEKFYHYCCDLLEQAEVAYPIKSDLILEFLERQIDKVVESDWDSVSSEYYYEVIARMGDIACENEFISEKMFSLKEEQEAA